MRSTQARKKNAKQKFKSETPVKGSKPVEKGASEKQKQLETNEPDSSLNLAFENTLPEPILSTLRIFNAYTSKFIVASVVIDQNKPHSYISREAQAKLGIESENEGTSKNNSQNPAIRPFYIEIAVGMAHFGIRAFSQDPVCIARKTEQLSSYFEAVKFQVLIGEDNNRSVVAIVNLIKFFKFHKRMPRNIK